MKTFWYPQKTGGVNVRKAETRDQADGDSEPCPAKTEIGRHCDYFLARRAVMAVGILNLGRREGIVEGKFAAATPAIKREGATKARGRGGSWSASERMKEWKK